MYTELDVSVVNFDLYIALHLTLRSPNKFNGINSQIKIIN